MRKFLVTCALALTLTAAAQQEASAWCRFNFSAGINVSYEGANNCILWGLLSGGPAPCAYGYPAPFAPPAFAYPGYPAFDGYAAAPPAPVAAPAVAQPAAQAPVHQANYTWGQTNYAPTSYYPQNYYQPSYGYGYGYGYSAPSYWYGY